MDHRDRAMDGRDRLLFPEYFLAARSRALPSHSHAPPADDPGAPRRLSAWRAVHRCPPPGRDHRRETAWQATVLEDAADLRAARLYRIHLPVADPRLLLPRRRPTALVRRRAPLH